VATGPPRRACGVNAAVKVPCLVAGMAAEADSIDDMGPVAAQRDERLVRRDPRPVHARLAPALYTWGNVAQLEKASREFLADGHYVRVLIVTVAIRAHFGHIEDYSRGASIR
jgi:hypothetical protein